MFGSALPRGFRAAGFAVCLFAVGAGCKRKAEPRVLPLAGTASAVLPRPPAHEFPVRNGVTRTVEAAGLTRSYVWIAPKKSTPPGTAPTANAKLPLVLVFHGDGGDGAGMHRGFPFETASGEGALLAYPNGIGATWDLETKAGNRDTQFIEALINDLVANERVDSTRVFAVGYSSGGFLANMVGCRVPGLFRGISSSAAGAPYAEQEIHGNGYPKCPGQKPLAVLALHGRRDHAVSWDSGRFSASYWAYVNGCNVQEMEPTGYSECTAYRGCPAGRNVAFCDIVALDHWVWTEAAAASWEFFSHL